MTGADLLVTDARMAGRAEMVSILIRAGVIETVGAPADVARPRRVPAFDAAGGTIAPGFIDLQVNGAAGHDLTGDPDAVWAVGAALPRWGVTAFLPTLVSSPAATYRAALEVPAAGAPAGYRGAMPLGFHFEGPFIAESRHGAHEPGQIRRPDRRLAAKWTRRNGVAMVTLAPELAGALELIHALRRAGVVVAAGHSAATAAEAHAGFQAGIRAVTHLWNAMPPLDHRTPGLVGAALADARIAVGLIPDGLHVDPDVVLATWRAVGRRRFVAVTDAIAALGQPDGHWPLGGASVDVRHGAARLADGRLAGSVLALDAGLRNLVRWSGGRLVAALAAVTAAPARVLGEGRRRGHLRPGAAGDIVVLDEQLEPRATIIGGEVVFDREEPGR